MNMPMIRSIGVLVVGAVLACWVSAVGADDKNPLLLRVQPAGLEGHELYVWRTHYPPGSTTDLHRHNGDEVVYVLEGAIVARVGGKTVTLSQGELVHVPEGTPMRTRNASATESGDTLIIMLARKGRPLHENVD